MNEDSELSRLERFVEKLLVKYEELREEKAQLLKTLAERDSLIEDLEITVLTNDSERMVISERVNKIVDQIEEWEMNLEDESEADGVAEKDDDTTEIEPEESDDDKVDKEDDGRMQHNLFSVEESK